MRQTFITPDHHRRSNRRSSTLATRSKRSPAVCSYVGAGCFAMTLPSPALMSMDVALYCSGRRSPPTRLPQRAISWRGTVPPMISTS